MKKLIFLFALVVVCQVPLLASSKDVHHIEMEGIQKEIGAIRKGQENLDSITKFQNDIHRIQNSLKDQQRLNEELNDNLDKILKVNQNTINYPYLIHIICSILLIIAVIFWFFFKETERKQRSRCLITVFIVEVVCAWIILSCELINIKDYEQLTIVMLGAPYAFFLWRWRNADKKKDQIQKAHDIRAQESANRSHKNEVKAIKETNRQAEFHKLQEWASDINTPPPLRYAAIFQFIPYLKKGDLQEKKAIIYLMQMILEEWALTRKNIPIKIGERKHSQASNQKLSPPIKIKKYLDSKKFNKPKHIEMIHQVIDDHGDKIFQDPYDLKNIDLSYIFFSNVIKFDSNTPLSKAKFINCSLKKNEFKCCPINDAVFTGSDLIEVTFTDLEASHSFFDDTFIETTTFEKTKLNDANFNSAFIKNSHFLNIHDCCVADFRNCVIDKVNFKSKTKENSNYCYIKFNECIFQRVTFNNVNLSWATFENARIEKNSVFKGVDFEETDFSSTLFSGVTFENVDFEKTIFKNTSLNDVTFRDTESIKKLFEEGAIKSSSHIKIDSVTKQTILDEEWLRLKDSYSIEFI
jgi:uncharacterized protein YjbI with pentapeptide repeats